MVTVFLTTYAIEIACSGAFLVGVIVHARTKSKKQINPYKIQYCDVSDVIKQYKSLDKKMNESIGGNKNDKFFK